MALLDRCIRGGISCACAHVNYHHRPQAEEEEAYIRSFCEERGIVCFVKNDPFEWTGNFEAAAREYRYDWFARVVNEHGFSGVLTAHHMDDLIETYFMQEEKGLIPDYYGLKEDRMISGVRVLRPLLNETKAQLAEYCRTNHIRTFYDETNEDTSLTRNRVRHEILNGMSMQEKQMVLREIAQKNAVLQERRCRVNAWVKEGGLRADAYRTWEEEDRLTALRDCLVKANLHRSRRGLQELDGMIQSGQDILIPLAEKQVLTVRNGELTVMEKPEPYCYTVNDEAQLRALVSEDFRIEDGKPGVNAVTVRAEDWPLTVRSVREGDRIALRFGHKSVHRFFIDRKIPKYDRIVWPVVTNRNHEVILVPGLGCDMAHYSIDPGFSVIQLSRCK